MTRANLVHPILALLIVSATASASGAGAVWQTDCARIRVDGHGFVTSLRDRQTGIEYLAPRKRSPLVSLQAQGRTILPIRATYSSTAHRLTIDFVNGSRAAVAVAVRGSYLRLRLVRLDRRGDVDNIVWGPIHTTISKTIGDLIGVVRDDRWAIGMLALDDNTTEGPPVPGDFGQMYYYVHSPDPATYPVPPRYHEGERFSIGGDGRSDVAFYSHPEEYFHMGLQAGAVLEPGSGSVIAYHSRDRRKPQSIFWTLIPGLPTTLPRHQAVDPVDADFIGSAIALYACPDERGRTVIHRIVEQEGLEDLTMDGKWAKDPAAYKPDIAWYGPHDRMLAYAHALKLDGVQDEGLGEFYMDPADPWAGARVGFANRRPMTLREFGKLASTAGVRYGLHTLCMFIQPRSTDVHPDANPHLQTVLRTHLAEGLTPESTDVVVTDPSYLGERGTWHDNGTNVLRTGTELLTYDGISPSAPWKLTGVKRGAYGTTASAHPAGEELDKLQINCYHGFMPDMRLILTYADLYAKRLSDLGEQYVDFDGLESCMYQNHGDFAFKTFYRRLFDTYRKLTGGKALRVMGSCVCEGNWQYMSVCNVGGGTNMFDPVANKWGIEGKDVRYAFASSYFPCTFGIQDYHSDWTVYDAENLEAKSIGWDATYMLGLSADAVEGSGEKAAIFRSFRTWEDARTADVFTPGVKSRLRDMGLKFDLVRTPGGFALRPVRELAGSALADGAARSLRLTNPYAAQAMELAIRVAGPKGARAAGLTVALPGGGDVQFERPVEVGEIILIRGDRAWLADANRRPLFSVPLTAKAVLAAGPNVVTVKASGGASLQMTAWALGPKTVLRRG